MTAFGLTPLEGWTAAKLGLAPEDRLTRQDIETYQLAALNRTLIKVRTHSPFYRQRVAGHPDTVDSLNDLKTLPFTTAEDLRRDPLAFLCVSQEHVARAITLKTSGTVGVPKRLFFTDTDQELTIDFFRRGMATFTKPGERVLVLLPGDFPGSVGDLLVKGLSRLPAKGIVHGPVLDPAAAVCQAIEEKTTCMVGIPVQVLAMACHPGGEALRGQIDSVLLSTDYVPDALVARIEKRWGCRVYKHYGMTEMGFGGGVECMARRGYHLREADLLLEIIDPETGQPLSDGNPGEAVITTLTREGMPLIRYRTGDLAAFRVDPCPCGSVLKSLRAIQGRRDGILSLQGGQTLCIADLDESLFAVHGVVDYRARLSDHADLDCLTLEIVPRETAFLASLEPIVREAVLAVAGVRHAMDEGRLALEIRLAESLGGVSTGAVKRSIKDHRERISG